MMVRNLSTELLVLELNLDKDSDSHWKYGPAHSLANKDILDEFQAGGTAEARQVGQAKNH